jgi:glycosyltransferase involved in cell wall biosynthesis
MKVGLNATCLNDRPSGAKQRFLGIYGSLFNLLPDVEFVIFEPRDCRVADWFPSQPNLSKRETPIPSLGRAGKLLKGCNYWKRSLASENFDAFEAMHMPLTRPSKGKTLLTIHDIRGATKENSFAKRKLFSSVLRNALKRADHVVTVSNTVRSEILSFYPNTPVSVIYNGVDSSAVQSVTQQAIDALRTKYDLPREYILAVGHFEKRKNYVKLIEAIALLKQRKFDSSLVIIGNDSGELVSLKKLISDMNLNDNISLLTDLSNDEVRCAYSNCALLAFPSSYEGFGIPILEAMAAGKPMALSDLEIFREITQNQSVYFDEGNVESMADAIEIGLCSQQVRDDMVEYGFHRVHDFEFGHLANSLCKLYRAHLLR